MCNYRRPIQIIVTVEVKQIKKIEKAQNHMVGFKCVS